MANETNTETTETETPVRAYLDLAEISEISRELASAREALAHYTKFPTNYQSTIEGLQDEITSLVHEQQDLEFRLTHGEGPERVY